MTATADARPVAAQSLAKAWAMLLLAAVFEIIFALATGKTEAFTVLWPSVIAIVGVALSIYFLTQALKTLDVGVGYTVWTGIGSVGTVLLGAVLFDESLSLAEIGCFVLIIGGVIGLQQSDRKPKAAAAHSDADSPTDADYDENGVCISVRCGGTAALGAHSHAH